MFEGGWSTLLMIIVPRIETAIKIRTVHIAANAAASTAPPELSGTLDMLAVAMHATMNAISTRNRETAQLDVDEINT